MAEINGMSGELLYGKVLTPDGIIEQGVIAVAEGLIQYVGEAAWLPAAYEGWQTVTREPQGLLIPGFVDVHVHGEPDMTSCTAMQMLLTLSHGSMPHTGRPRCLLQP